MTRGWVLLPIVALLGSWAVAQEEDKKSEPKRTGVVERAGTRLVQIEVNLRGPKDTLDSLTRDDFRLSIGRRRVREFEVDKLCRDPNQSRSLEKVDDETGSPAAGTPALGPTTFLFYFDQQHLTMSGRHESIDILEKMIPELIKNGNRGSIVSNGRNLETLAEPTADPEVLLAALEEMEGDFDHFDADAQLEEGRILEVQDLMRVDTENAAVLAQRYYWDELWRVERNLHRLSITLGKMAMVDRPKATIYFADNMRRLAGAHYLELLSVDFTRYTPGFSRRAVSGTVMGAQLPFDRVVNEAAAHGIRLYPIEGQGLEVPTPRIRESEGTLRVLALETGGEAFLNGVQTHRILEKLEQDLSCIHMISFSPEGLPRDVSRRVAVKVRRPKVEVQSCGRLVIQSDSARRTSRLMAAFATRSVAESEITIHPAIVPTGHVDGKFTALVQVTVPRSEVPASTWDLGISAISRGKVRDVSGRLTVSHSGAAMVLQESMKFASGPFEIVSVAHNTTVDSIASNKLEGEWPKPNSAPASLGPIAVVQSRKAAILRDDQTMTSGHVAFAEEEPVLAGRPVTLVALVCRSKEVEGELLIERQLVGADTVRFEPMEIDLGEEACAVIHDNVRAGTMTPGTFRYRIQVHDRTDELTRGERRFFVWDGNP